MATCKHCGQEIQFIRTTKGKLLPCDVDELRATDCTVGMVLVSFTGQMHRVTGGNQVNIKGYPIHFGTCEALQKQEAV